MWLPPPAHVARVGSRIYTYTRSGCTAYVAGAAAALPHVLRIAGAGSITNEGNELKASGIPQLDATLARLRAHSDAMAQTIAGLRLLEPESIAGPPQEHLQKALTAIINDKIVEGVVADLRTADPNDVRASGQRAATFISGASQTAAAVFTTIPTRVPHTQMSDDAYTIACKLRLGVPLLRDSCPCAACGGTWDVWGSHAQECRVIRGRTAAHNHTRDELATIIRMVGGWGVVIEPKVELPRNLTTAAGTADATKAFRADIRIDMPNRSMYVDVVGHHPSARGATKQGVAAAEAHRDKLKKYSDRFIIAGKLIPFAFETMGFVGEAGMALIKFVARSVPSGRKGVSRLIHFLYLRIGMAVLRGTVNTVTKSLKGCVLQELLPAGGEVAG